MALDFRRAPESRLGAVAVNLGMDVDKYKTLKELAIAVKEKDEKAWRDFLKKFRGYTEEYFMNEEYLNREPWD